MRRFCTWCLLVLGLAGFALPGCGGPSRTQVGFVSNNNAEFWSIAQVGASKAAKEEDVELLFRGARAIALSVIDPPNQRQFLDQIASRVPLLAVDNDAPDSKRLCYLGTDNYAAGKAAGQLVRKAMPQGGTIAIFVGQIEPLNAQQRRQGVLDELAGQKDARGEMYGKYKLVGLGAERGPYLDNVDSKRAKENADDVLAQLKDEPNVCLIGLWAPNAPACYEAVRAKGLEGKVTIVGFDEDRQTLDGIRKGGIFGTIVQDPYNFGYRSVKMMAALVKGDRSGLPKDGILAVPHRVITNDKTNPLPGQQWENVDGFQKKLNELTGQQ
jgi:ribose transport system substrate-binding protein